MQRLGCLSCIFSKEQELTAEQRAQQYATQQAIIDSIPSLVKELTAHTAHGTVAPTAVEGGSAAEDNEDTKTSAEKLSEFSWSRTNGPNSAVQDAFLEAGGIPILVSLLRSHDQRTRENAAGAIGNLSVQNVCNQSGFAAAGCIPMLIALLDQSSPSSVQEKAAWALAQLTNNHKENKAIAIAAGAVPIMWWLKDKGHGERVRDNARLALGRLG